MEKTENSETDITPVNVQPSVIIEGNKNKLPKIILQRNENFNVSLEELDELDKKYYVAVSEMKEGTAFAPPELKSKMESALDIAYDEELENIRLKNQCEREVERQFQIGLNLALTPRTWRNWWWPFILHKNQAQILLEERIRREVINKLIGQEEELPDCGETEEVPYSPYAVQIEELKELLPRRIRKKKRAQIEVVIEGLAVSYKSKMQEQKRIAAELYEVRKQLQEAQERICELQELTEELMKESEPVVEEETETQEQGETESQDTPENSERKEEEQPDTADEGEEDELYYDELEDDEE